MLKVFHRFFKANSSVVKSVRGHTTVFISAQTPSPWNDLRWMLIVQEQELELWSHQGLVYPIFGAMKSVYKSQEKSALRMAFNNGSIVVEREHLFKNFILKMAKTCWLFFFFFFLTGMWSVVRKHVGQSRHYNITHLEPPDRCLLDKRFKKKNLFNTGRGVQSA